MKTVTGYVFDRVNGQTTLRAASLEEQLKHSIRAVLLTRRGERCLHPDYGSDLYRYLFRPLNEGLVMELKAEIRTSIERSEPRVAVKEVSIHSQSIDPESLDVGIRFFHRNSLKAGQVRVKFHA